VTQVPHGDASRPRVDHAAFVGAAQIDGEWFGKVETNPSRFLDPLGCSLLPFDLVGQAVDAMAELAANVLPVDEHPDTWKVTRVDVARDFLDVPDPALFVRALAPLPRPYARRSFVYRDPTRNRAETMAIGSNSGMVRLYDRHSAHGARGAEPCSLRWELEARTPWLGGARAGDLSPAFFDLLAAHRWEWSACGTVVTTADGMVARVESRTCRHKRPRGRCEESCDGLSPAKAMRLLGSYALGHAGIMRSDLPARTRRHYAMEARDLGAVVDDDAPGSVRLDWHAGTIVGDVETPF
jgi:hypothetical protein